MRWLLFPALTVGPAALALYGLRQGLPMPAVLGGTVALAVALQLLLERALPYRREWNSRLLLQSDLLWLGLALITSRLLDAALPARSGWGLWPSSWPLVLQALLAILLADLGHYWAHRALHGVPWLWSFHQVHHGPDHLYTLNFFRMHPVDIVLKTSCNLAPLVLLGAGPEVIAIWSVVSGVSAGSLNHANIALDTRWLDGWLSTPALHRWHHSQDPREGNTNFGNVTMLYDRLFGTYLRPRDREVAAVGVDGTPSRMRALARLGAFAGATCAALGVLALRWRPLTVRVVRLWGRSMISLLGVELELEGPLPPQGSIIVANHRSYLDIPALASLVTSLFVAKQEVGGWPLLGRAASLAETIFVRRDDPGSRARALRAVQRALHRRQTVTIFPEGTTFGGPGVLPFEPGCFRLASSMGMPVVPVALEYGRAEDAWTDPDDGTFVGHFLQCLSHRKVRLRVVFGAPLEPDRLQVQQWIEAHLRRPGAA